MTQFKITQMDRNTVDGFVTTVHWTASQVDGDFSASTYSTANFIKEDGINYVPYESLTEAAVIDWVKASLGAQVVEGIGIALAAQISDHKAPKVAAGVPW